MTYSYYNNPWTQLEKAKTLRQHYNAYKAIIDLTTPFMTQFGVAMAATINLTKNDYGKTPKSISDLIIDVVKNCIQQALVIAVCNIIIPIVTTMIVNILKYPVALLIATPHCIGKSIYNWFTGENNYLTPEEKISELQEKIEKKIEQKLQKQKIIELAEYLKDLEDSQHSSGDNTNITQDTKITGTTESSTEIQTGDEVS